MWYLGFTGHTAAKKLAIYLLNAQPLGDMVFPASTSKMWVVVFIAVFDARVIADRLLTI